MASTFVNQPDMYVNNYTEKNAQYVLTVVFDRTTWPSQR
jgi:hypothetical protein